jgi:transcriptional regulator with XRE-family HTH domain
LLITSERSKSMSQNLSVRRSEESIPANRQDLPFCDPELGERIVQLRRCKGWSRGELAGRLGVSRYRLAKWEQGANPPPFGVLAPLAQTLEVTLDELLTGEPAPSAGLGSGQKAEARSYIAGLARLLGLSRDPNQAASPKERRL